MKKYFFLLFISIIYSSCGVDELTETQENEQFSYEPVETVKYRQDLPNVDNDLLSYDIYYDETTTALKPVIIWVHGGGWSIGDKTSKMQNKIPYFESLGYVVVSVNYRLSPTNNQGVPNDLLNENRIKFPTHPQDVANAVATIYHGIHNFNGDKNNMVIMGHSAGAHLAMLLATDPQYLNAYNLEPTIFKGVVNFDTEAYNIKQHLENHGVTNFNTAALAIQTFLNDIDNFLNDPNFNIENDAETDITSVTYLNAFGMNVNDWYLASPINHINHQNKPDKYFIYYQGDSNIARRQLIRDFISELRNTAQVISGETFGLAHNEINELIGVTLNAQTMTDELSLFLEDCFD